MKKLTLTLSVSLGLSTQLFLPKSFANNLQGPCYDYASRTSSTSTTVDYQSGALSLANNFAGLAFESSPALSVVYPLLHDTIMDSLNEESVNGADSELVGCLSHFESRISNLEISQLTGPLNDIQHLMKSAHRDATSNLKGMHYDLAEKYSKMADDLATVIQSQLAQIDSGSVSKTTFDTLTRSVIPGFVSAMQMTFLHRAEFDNMCENLDTPPYWHNLSDDGLVPYATLYDIREGTQHLTNLFTRPEESSSDNASCTLGYATFFDFMSLKDGNWGEALRQIGLEVVPNGRNPSLISVRLNFEDSKLIQYREAFISPCRHNAYKDDYDNYTMNASHCDSNYNSRISQIRNPSFLDQTSRHADVKEVMYSLAHVIDAWDLNNLIKTRNELTGNTGNIDFHNALRLKHGPSNLCVDQQTKVRSVCTNGASHFVFEPFNGGYSIQRAEDNRYFKDKGGDADFKVYSDRGNDATWYLSSANSQGRYQLKNKSTGRCLIASGDTLSVGGCSGAQWEINGSHVPADNTLVRLRDTSNNTCVSQNCDSDTYELRLTHLDNGYKITRYTDGKHLRNQSDIGFSNARLYRVITPGSPFGPAETITEPAAVWYIYDANGDNKFALRNKETNQCLVTHNGSLSNISCNDNSEVWAFDRKTPPLGRHLQLAQDGMCLWSVGYIDSKMSYGLSAGCEQSMKRVTLEGMQGGYLIHDPLDGHYLTDPGAAEYDHFGLTAPTEPSDNSIWDFIGPYGNGKYQIRNRVTEKCLSSKHLNQYTRGAMVISCSEEESKSWEFKTR
ncbi:hypothetical protein CWB99_09005 [Pseudoalteromonas rubra]|uniref:Uncharacterized protein n=1 Tax=Pseudoalteromonas rubra TaxID=43658 RepID=A0A5S3WNS1_9GAMM|nr:RICIN domain-containing protein [Pseudoalteromonas rubra]TMP29327.1 hypothetical protein CWB99_09005 [Pseudoalteromonas rubra]TMP34068.1 hypothetical protein CWC00_09235 [Pseudoalteromonas rubra]